MCPSTERRRRWFQFSLWTLLVATALAAGLAFAWAKCVEPYRLQREAMAVITKLGGSYKTEDATGWVRYLDRNPQDIVVVDLADCDAPSEYLPHLARLGHLETLVVGGHSVGDEQVAALGRVGSLKGLVLDSTTVTDQCVTSLQEGRSDLVVYRSERRAAARLRTCGVYLFPFGPNRAKDNLPDWLLTEVGEVYFIEPPVHAVVLFAAVPQAKTSIADDDLVDLTALAKLEDLNVADTRITDGGIPHLEKCIHLTFLDISGTELSPGGIQRLQIALPHCRIRH